MTIKKNKLSFFYEEFKNLVITIISNIFTYDTVFLLNKNFMTPFTILIWQYLHELVNFNTGQFSVKIDENWLYTPTKKLILLNKNLILRKI